mmetsp:Transcript_1127/g.2904  ORF Transcript_1127/g.2904 Transcript_1127/m.2904 type:complete len:210 (-) Transcript_1127:82-711(-)
MLFDGHGGSQCAQYLADHLPTLIVSALPTARGGEYTANWVTPGSSARVWTENGQGASFGGAVHLALGRVDRDFCESARRKKHHAGSTVLLALVGGCDGRFDQSALAPGDCDIGCGAGIDSVPRLFVANIGDSRCILGQVPHPPATSGSGRGWRATSTSRLKAVRLSVDHISGDEGERKRIVDAGGRVTAGRVSVDSCLMSSAAVSETCY